MCRREEGRASSRESLPVHIADDVGVDSISTRRTMSHGVDVNMSTCILAVNMAYASDTA